LAIFRETPPARGWARGETFTHARHHWGGPRCL